MTRKDFELIAEVLAAGMTTANLSDPTDKPTYSEGYKQAIKDMAATFAYRLTDTNPRFDTDRFLKAALNEGLLK